MLEVTQVALRHAPLTSATPIRVGTSARPDRGGGSRPAPRGAVSAAGPREPIRALVADYSPFLRAGVRLALEWDGFFVCAEAGDAVAAVEAALRERPDVCLLDADLPGGGLAAVEEISAKLPDARVVVFSDSRGDAELLAALQAGAWGYLSKDIKLDRLPVTLRRVLEGEPALPRALVARLIEKLREGERRKRLAVANDLTRREFEVLELLSERLTTSEIASRLFVENVTVRTHISSILRKLGVPDRQSAVRRIGEYQGSRSAGSPPIRDQLDGRAGR